MKNYRSFLAVAALGMASAASAQNLNSGYFTEGYLYRHDLNPAFANEQNYIAMPALGNFNVGINSNLGVNDVLFNVNGRTALFLNPNVSASEFLSGINDKNKINENLKIQILGAGFKGSGGYNTIEINDRQSLGVQVPGSILRLAKDGVQNQTYDISDLHPSAVGYAELALGHSRQINENLRVGAKLKVLLGIANVDAEVTKGQITLGEDSWTGVTNAKLQASIKDLKFEMEEKERGAEGEETTHRYVSGIDDSSWGINGFGLAVDLGAEYKLDDNWKFSAAILDLGYIGWNTNFVASTNGDKQVSTGDYKFNLDDDEAHSFENEMDRLTEGLAALYELDDNGDAGSRSKALAATMNLGVEYTPDFYNKMSFGLMNSTRFAGKYSYTDFRLSANVAPCKIFSASANFSVNTYGTSMGWLLNLHPTGFNLFLGMDHTLGKIAKQGVPLSGRGSVSLGINFPFN